MFEIWEDQCLSQLLKPQQTVMDRAKWETLPALLPAPVEGVPCRGWNEMGFEVPPNPNHSVCLCFFIATFPQVSTEILSQPSLPVSSGEQGG